MAEQERAVRTRRTILLAAAKVFQERGYKAATIAEILSEAAVTKGALYFHFSSKEDLAQEVISSQNQDFTVPDCPSKVQEVVDAVLLHTHHLRTDPMVRAAVRLAMDQLADGLDRGAAFVRWNEIVQERLEKAQAQGELLPHINPAETAGVIVGTYAGIQSMSQALSDYQDLTPRVNALLRHLLPSIVIPSVLASVDTSENRTLKLHNQLTAQPA
ncbi:ScbR family autoregulator-binding transcription factor [Streptomyces sp. NRRL S-813]|uniref:ScbR family autoregulator-binding transcription factor n=1 Tax=Streptomyces sp. NRRL S-813 TaxID=1463919 RepID=UPI0004BE5D96|nr:ScbR family autoregulator-binding transcription factor [Streptomyces sp. NRRL S-813]